MSKSCLTRWNEKMRFTSSLGSGHDLVLDAVAEVGGEDRGPRPKELLLSALGGCTGMDVISILNKMRAEYDSFEVFTEGDESVDHPRVFTHIRVVYRLSGAEESKEKLLKAVNLSWTRYCGVTNMLNKAAKVTYRVEFNGKSIAEGE